MPAHWSQPDDRRSPAVSGVKLTIVTAITRRVLTECQQLLVCILFTWQGCSTTRSNKPSLSGRIQFRPQLSKKRKKGTKALGISEEGIICMPVTSVEIEDHTSERQ